MISYKLFIIGTRIVHLEEVNDMIIILVRIQAITTKQDIDELLSPVLKGGLFQKSGYIKRIKILILRDGINNSIEYHGIVAVDSDVAGKRAIKKLNRKAFKGKHIEVREYHLRTRHNDPRIHGLDVNKKLVNRRRKELKEAVHASITYIGIESFHRNFLGSTN